MSAVARSAVVANFKILFVWFSCFSTNYEDLSPPMTAIGFEHFAFAPVADIIERLCFQLVLISCLPILLKAFLILLIVRAFAVASDVALFAPFTRTIHIIPRSA